VTTQILEQEAFGRLRAEPLDWRYRSIPATTEGVTIATIAERGWNVLAGDLPLPAMVLKQSALDHNIALLARHCREHDVLLAPHGKTTMAPQIFARQLDAGAWGMTAATVAHVRTYRAFGIQRILLANELVDPAALRWLAAELASDPEFDFYCLVDSPAAVDAMEAVLTDERLERPVQVLVEVGVRGGRTGCRTEEEAAAVAKAVAGARTLVLAGVEGYEGVIGADRSDETLAAVDGFLRSIRSTTVALETQGAFTGREQVLVTAGGSAFFDRVIDVLGSPWPLAQPVTLVLRCGSYASHDSALYERVSPFAAARYGGDGLQPALEVWAAVLSRPERDLAIAGFGKRDAPHDVDLPLPRFARDGSGLRDVAGRVTVRALMDQHAFLHVPPEDALAVGDLIGCGISHPCTAFDKWSLIPVVDGDYTVVDAVRTFF
jgi:D-serine deaminase-like pyridoxal phosphate-dependent protein